MKKRDHSFFYLQRTILLVLTVFRGNLRKNGLLTLLNGSEMNPELYAVFNALIINKENSDYLLSENIVW